MNTCNNKNPKKAKSVIRSGTPSFIKTDQLGSNEEAMLLHASDEESSGTLDVNLENLFLESCDTCSIASSSFSNLSTSSKKTKNCKLTVKRLGTKLWEELTEKERKRLHNARAYLQDLSSTEREPIASTSGGTVPPVDSGVEGLMGPPKSVTSHCQSRPMVIISATPELKSGSEGRQDPTDPSKPTSTGSTPPLGVKINREADGEKADSSGVTSHCYSRKKDKPDPQRPGESSPSDAGMDSSVASLATVVAAHGRRLGLAHTSNIARESKRTYNRKRNAIRLIRRLKKRDPESYTDKDKEALDRAENTLRLLRSTRRTNTGPKDGAPGSVMDSSRSKPAACPRKAMTRRDTVARGTGVRLSVTRRESLLPSTSAADRLKPPVIGSDEVAKPKSGQIAGCSKRGRLDDTTSPPTQRLSKKAKMAVNSANGLQVAIVDFNNPDRRLSSDQWRLVELRILDGVNDAIVQKQGSIPFFEQLTTFKGFKIIACDNEATLKWLKSFVASTQAPWANADIRLVEKKDLLEFTRPKGRILIPGPHIPRERIERNLQHLNPELYSENWKVLEVGEHTEEGTEIVVLLNHRSMPILRRYNYKVRIGITRCKVRPIIGKVDRNKREASGKVI